jgi:hypothetical protein
MPSSRAKVRFLRSRSAKECSCGTLSQVSREQRAPSFRAIAATEAATAVPGSSST